MCHSRTLQSFYPILIHENPESDRSHAWKGLGQGTGHAVSCCFCPRGGRDFLVLLLSFKDFRVALVAGTWHRSGRFLRSFKFGDYGSQIDKKLTRSCCSKYVSRAFPHRTTVLRSLADIWDETFCNKMHYKSLQYMSTSYQNILTLQNMCILHDASSRFVGPWNKLFRQAIYLLRRLWKHTTSSFSPFIPPAPTLGSFGNFHIWPNGTLVDPQRPQLLSAQHSGRLRQIRRVPLGTTWHNVRTEWNNSRNPRLKDRYIICIHRKS